MAKVYRTASGARDPSGRDLVFEQWFQDNIVAVEGGAIEQRSIYGAYRRDTEGESQLGEQGVERMLNQLKVKRSVRQGKPYRLGVGFKRASADAPVAEATLTIKPGGAESEIRIPARQPGWLSGGWRYGAVVLEIAAANEAEAFGALALRDVYVERHRQVTEEGFDAAHDDRQDPGAHERAMACYAYAAAQPDRLAPFVETNAKQPRDGKLGWLVRDLIVMMWPWATQWWKPQTDRADWKRRCLVRACALGLAAIERIDREKARADLEAAQRSQMTGV